MYNNVTDRIIAAAQNKFPGSHLIASVTIGTAAFIVPGVVAFSAYPNFEAGAHKADEQAGWTASLQFGTTINEELREIIEAALNSEKVEVKLQYLAQDYNDRTKREETDSEISFTGIYVKNSPVEAPSFNCSEEPVAKIDGKSAVA
jgi:hypothetical protein